MCRGIPGGRSRDREIFDAAAQVVARWQLDRDVHFSIIVFGPGARVGILPDPPMRKPGPGFFLMAELRIAANLPDTDEAIDLARALNDDDAWRFMVKLWAHQLLAENIRGVLRASPKKIREVCGYKGASKRLVGAMISSTFLVEKDDGFYMRGWSRNRRYLEEKQRRRDAQRARREAKRDGHEEGTEAPSETDVLPDSLSLSLSQSLSPTHEERGEGSPDFLDRVDQVIQLALDRLHLAMPGTGYQTRIASQLPLRRELVVVAIEATLKADRPNWNFLIKCLEDPVPTTKPQRRRGPPTDEELLASTADDDDYDPVLDPESDCYQPERDPKNPAYRKRVFK